MKKKLAFFCRLCYYIIRSLFQMISGFAFVRVAQLDRASDYGSEGRVFESCRAHSLLP